MFYIAQAIIHVYRLGAFHELRTAVEYVMSPEVVYYCPNLGTRGGVWTGEEIRKLGSFT
jgi:hypothetical protein